MINAINPDAIALANRLAKRSRTVSGKVEVAVVADKHLTGCALYLGAAIGCRETAEILYRLADFFAVQEVGS